MFGFREFLNEGGYHIPVVSISKDKVDLSKERTRDELNRNLSAVLAREYTNPYIGLLSVSKMLTLYGINLPRILLDDEIEGEVVVILHQFGETVGAKLDVTINTMGDPEADELFLVYQYCMSDAGFIEACATVVTDEELGAMLDEDEQYEDEKGDLDPRQV